MLLVSRTCSNEFGGLGAQIIDAMDSLWIMGLEHEYLGLLVTGHLPVSLEKIGFGV